MDSRSFLLSLFRLFSPFLLLILTTSRASPASGEWFLNCDDQLNCDSKESPLWNINGMENCGGGNPKSMKPICQDSGGRKVMKIIGEKYEVLGFNMGDPLLILIAEIGYTNRFCSQKEKNASAFVYAMIYESCRPPPPRNPTCPDASCSLSTEVKIPASLLNETDYEWKRVEQRTMEYFKSTREVKLNEKCGQCWVPGAVYDYDLQSNQTRCCCADKGPEFCHSRPAAY